MPEKRIALFHPLSFDEFPKLYPNPKKWRSCSRTAEAKPTDSSKESRFGILVISQDPNCHSAKHFWGSDFNR
jgi:hypothetical protein